MSVNPIRKKWAFSNEPIPRSTLYWQRKRKELRSFRTAATAFTLNRTVHEDADIITIANKCPRSSDSSSPNHCQSRVFHGASEENFSDQEDAMPSSPGSSDGQSENTDHSDFRISPNHDPEVTTPGSLLSDKGMEEAGHGDSVEHHCAAIPDYKDTEPLFLEGSAEPVFQNAPTSELNSPLNELTSTTEGDALLMCLALGFRHSLSWTAMTDILCMINQLFNREVVKATKYFFLKYMEPTQGKISFHIYCPICERYLGTKKDLTSENVDACQCGAQLKENNEASTFFLSVNLASQFKDLLKNQQFVESLNYRFKREKLNENAFEDIYDGELYCKLSKPGEILHEHYNMSYTFNTDGCPIGKYSKQTCWPIYMQINELPPKLRSKYMILAGIYVGKKEPNMKIFMHPFVEEANELAIQGVSWVLNDKIINSKIIPLCACVDSVARCKLLNMTQFNGWYGCTLCHYRGELITKTGIRYTLPLNGMNERTHESILLDSVQAHNNFQTIQNKKKRSVRGCKGPTPIHNLQHLDLVRGMRPDPMHSMMLGNARHHTSLLTEGYGQRYYIGSDVRLAAISSRLLSIKPPTSMMRTPRHLKEMSLWNAKEWRSWILFYGIVCLQGIIPDEFVIHFSMLSSALHILLQKSITPAKLNDAHILLLRYVFLYQEYFSKKAMVYNTHLLLHVKRSIECLGPAWTRSAFGFEGANKMLLQLKKGASSVAQEIARKFLTFKSLPLLCEIYASSEKALEFCEQLSGKSLKSFHRIEKTVLVGSGFMDVLNNEELDVLKTQGYTQSQGILHFTKLIHDGVPFTIANKRPAKTDDSYIFFHGGMRGRIQKILLFSLNEGHRSIVLVVRLLKIKDKPMFPDDFGSMSPIKEIEGDGQLCVVCPNHIEGQCVSMPLDNGNFICDIPFGCFGDS